MSPEATKSEYPQAVAGQLLQLPVEVLLGVVTIELTWPVGHVV